MIEALFGSDDSNENGGTSETIKEIKTHKSLQAQFKALSKAYPKQNTYVVLDVFTQWCGPCKKLAPLLEALAEKHKTNKRLVFLKYDGDPEYGHEDKDSETINERYGVTHFPTVFLFENGVVKDKWVGCRDEQISKRLDTLT
jgi:thioredoxin 1